MVLLPLILFVPSYYAEDLGLPLTGVGSAIAASRLLDVATDPIMGIISDRWQTRWGRRKPWLIAGTPFLILCTWMVFAPPAKASIFYLFLWTSLLFLAFDVFDLPYKAWGAELSTRYHERSRVAAWREAFGAGGHLLFLLIGTVMTAAGYGGSAYQLQLIAVLITLGLPLFVTLAAIAVPDRTPEHSRRERLALREALRFIWANKAFIRTAGALVLFGSGLMIQATLHKMVLKHVIGRPELFSPMILAETLISLLALPVWIRLSDRLGKHRTLTAAGLWVGVWGALLPLAGHGDIGLYITLIILRGSSLAAIIFLANAIAADVVDYDTAVSGRQRTGLYFSLWGMTIKLAIAAGVFLATSLPAAAGFDPSAGVHGRETLTAVMRIYGWLPCLLMTLAFPLLWNFPIDRDRQRQLRAIIDSRRLQP